MQSDRNCNCWRIPNLNRGGNDVYLAKFDTSGKIIWSTYFGGPNADDGSNIILDSFNNIYISGYTQSTSGIATTDAFQPTYSSGYNNTFIAKFDNNGSRLWASYYGFSWCYGIVWLNDYQILIAGYATNTPGIATSGAFQTKSKGTWNGFIADINFKVNNDAGISSIPSSKGVFCGNSQQLKISLKNYGNHELDSVKIGWSVNSKVVSSYAWTGKLKSDSSISVTLGSFKFPNGTDTIKVWTYNPNGTTDSTPQNDSSFAIITVNPTPSANAGKNRSVCFGVMDTIGSSSVPNDAYFWTSNPTSVIGSVSNPVVSPAVTTTYYLYETNSYACVGKDSVTLTVNPLPTANAGKDTLVCFGDSVFLGTKPDTGYSYSWSSSPSGFRSILANPRLVPKSSAAYYLSITSNSTGCTGLDTAYGSVNPLPHARFSVSDTLFCTQDSLGLIDSSTGAVSYVWTFGDGTTDTGKNIHKHHFTKTGPYHIRLIVTNSSGCSDSTKTWVYPDGDCVWPGDANYDKVDNIYDLLAIGIGYNNSEYNRLDTTTQWYAHPCEDWHKSFKSGTNYKHADCNGDGIIDSLDIAAIIRNYSKSHSKSGGSITSGNPNDPALSLSISKDSVGTSDTISVQMNLGTASKSLSNIYGICYTVTYDPVNVGRAKSFSADFSNCWMGTVGKNLVYLVHNDSVNGVMDIGITRTDHKNVSGYGEIGKLTIITPDNVGGKRLIRKELRFGFENIKAIDNVEDDVSLYTVGDSVLFYGYSAGIAPQTNTDSNIHLYPNPAQSILHIDAGKELISEIGISDILGRKVMTMKYAQVRQTDMNINSLIPGTYFIYIFTDHGFARSRFVKD